MRFSTATVAYLTSALVVALFPQAANAGITAFSGSTCNGAAGLNVSCDGSCHQFDDRHSFRVRPFAAFPRCMLTSSWTGRWRVGQPLRDGVPGPELPRGREGPAVLVHEPERRVPEREHGHEHSIVHLLAEQHLLGLNGVRPEKTSALCR